MSGPLPIVLVPGLNCTARLYAEQIPVLWGFGPVTVADHRRDDSMAAIAAHILATEPPRFALVGLSMGAISPLRSCARRPSGWRGSRCSILRRDPTRRNRASAGAL